MIPAVEFMMQDYAVFMKPQKAPGKSSRILLYDYYF
jgi:hypothetical protein